MRVEGELPRMIRTGVPRLRIYVQFSKAWLPYSKRRLKENPAVAKHAVRQMFGLRG